MGFSTNDRFSASFKLHSSSAHDKVPYAAVYKGVQFHLIRRSVTVLCTQCIIYSVCRCLVNRIQLINTDWTCCCVVLWLCGSENTFLVEFIFFLILMKIYFVNHIGSVVKPQTPQLWTWDKHLSGYHIWYLHINIHKTPTYSIEGQGCTPQRPWTQGEGCLTSRPLPAYKYS